MQTKKDGGYDCEAEEEILKFWQDSNTFVAEDKPNKFIMVLPPPNITGKLHIGHALMISIQDTIARYERLTGKSVFFLPGTDHAGIATQAVIEKTLNQQSINNLKNEELLEFAWKWKEEHENAINSQLKSMGATCDFSRSKFTLDPVFNNHVVEAFIELFNRKLIYRANKLVNYSPKLNSVISDVEVDYLEVNKTNYKVDDKIYKFGILYYFYYPVIKTTNHYSFVCRNSFFNSEYSKYFKLCKNCGGNENAFHFETIKYLPISTTRPETIFGDTGVFLNCKFKNSVDELLISNENEQFELFMNRIEEFRETKEVINKTKDAITKANEVITKANEFITIDELKESVNQIYSDVFNTSATINENEGFSKEYSCINPLTGLIIPMIFDQSIDINFGTGIMKATPAHDFNDYLLSEKYKIKKINILLRNKILITNNLRFEERVRIVEEFKKINLFIKSQEHSSKIPICSRTGDIIEPILKEQWFMKMDIKERAFEVIKNDEILIYPKENKKVLLNWIKNTRDWCLSRQLWWGHQIPAYKVYKCNRFVGWIATKNPKEYDYSNFNELSEGDLHGSDLSECEFRNSRGNNLVENNLVGNYLLENNLVENNLVENNLLENDSILINESITVIRDKDVLDTWFSSALCPIVHMRSNFNTFKPTDLLETGSDILFFWVIRMIYLTLLLENEIPFKKVLLHGIIRDSLGRKMSKSLGNVINPLFIIKGCTLQQLNDSISPTLSLKERKVSLDYQKKTFPNGIMKCGADALRFTLLNYINDSKDINLDIKRVEGYKRFTNKIYNLFRYYNNFYQLKNISNQNIFINDKCKEWINYKFNCALNLINYNLSKYNFMDACIALHSFILYDLCDLGVEISKELNILTDSLMKNVLIILHPFMPFISEKLFYSKYKKSILLEQWPVFEDMKCDFDDKIIKIKKMRQVEVRAVNKRYYLLVKAIVKEEFVEKELDEDVIYE